ncbi:MAG TPA: prolipoprotein diacylglyceryl transferase family protein [Anaerolineaceae bacterium]
MISSFSLCVGLGAALGMAWVAWRAPQERAGLWLNAGLLVLFGALIGARAAFVWSHPAYFVDHWLDIPQVWLGGLSWPGGLLGFWVSLGLISYFSRTSLGDLADKLLPLLPPLLVGAWLGSWLSGVAYGQVASDAWWALPAPDEWGTWSARIPLQVSGALVSVAIFLLIEWLSPQLKVAGQAASLAYLAICLMTLVLVSLRSDPVPVWHGWRWDILAAMLFSGCLLLVNLLAFWPRRKMG